MIAMKEKPPHKFFERRLAVTSDQLDDLYSFCLTIEQDLLDGKVDGVSKEVALEKDKLGGMTTRLLSYYNIFHYDHPVIKQLFDNVLSMAQEACTYYGTSFDEANYYVQGWVNIENADHGNEEDYANNMIEQNLHDHGSGEGMPELHGYFCVDAEPSVTHYKIHKVTPFENININGRAVISETGQLHTRGWWNGGPNNRRRITIAYDTRSIDDISKTEDPDYVFKHWIKLA